MPNQEHLYDLEVFTRGLGLPRNFKDKIDTQALEIVRELQKAGYRAYLVGGCVRDILLGIAPKDFDIATSANPYRVKSIIHRSQIIGKRFRIVVARRKSLFRELSKPCFPLLIAQSIFRNSNHYFS